MGTVEQLNAEKEKVITDSDIIFELDALKDVKIYTIPA